MPRLPLPESKLARFPFRLLPHFEFAAEELEKTLVWENAFQAEATFPRIELVQSELSELAQESLLVQSSPLSASGEFVLLLPRETILHPSAIFIVQKQIRRGDLDLVYWDETEYVPGTPQSLIRYIRKGRPSALSALGRNMIGGVAVLRKTLWDEVKEESDQKDALLWQLSLRIPESRMLQIPLALSSSCSSPKEQLQSVPLMNEFAKVLPSGSEVSLVETSTGPRTEIRLSPCDRDIGVAIPFRNQSEITLVCLHGLAKQTNSTRLHIRLINNGSDAVEREVIASALKQFKFKSAEVIDDDRYFNYARLNNRALSELFRSESKSFVLMNNDVELQTKDALEQLDAWARLSGVGLVGGTLRYPGGGIQSAGINFSQVRPANVSQEHLHADKLREVDGICFALVLITKDTLAAMDGGLDELLCPNGYGDALFCHQARKLGFRSLIVPWIEATHYESASRGVRPEELELLELVQSGVTIADLWGDLEAERQPMTIPLIPHSSAFHAVVRKVSANRTMLRVAEAICKPVVHAGKVLKRYVSI